MKLQYKIAGAMLASLVCVAFAVAMLAAPVAPPDDAALSAAICPLVYPVDQNPSDRGYHYLFYGNGFFINEQGYLITATHVLSQLRGGQPYILVRPASEPPQILKAILVAADREHDVAILRATPNPFEGNYKVGFLPLAQDWVSRGDSVVAASVHPSKPLDAYTLDASIEDRTPGEVFAFPFSQLEKGRNETELFLFNHEIRRGQSGAPVVSANSHAVVGLVEGEWLRSSLMPLSTTAGNDAPGTGAAVPIHYAIALLQQKGIAWHTASGALGPTDNAAKTTEPFSPPAPVSLVASPFPAQAIFGGEVVFDGSIDNHGKLTEIKVVRGESPFREKALATVRTWTFAPAYQDGQPVPSRMGIIFQYAQSYEPAHKELTHTYDEPASNVAERGALPVATREPKYPKGATDEGSVILQALIGPEGKLSEVRMLSGAEPLASAAKAAIEQWSFVPAKLRGANIDSAVIIVVTFRHAGNTEPAPQKN